ncbi:hypothetical protein [Anatilimnocola floriformis]|uniref:hypothetical protein n=1 Tax=Anatilimnocola floriformis TaxID=2948575 RepID=UPI0020C4E750|nr:hypothetical protein [Anatilimnocola floriformis]
MTHFRRQRRRGFVMLAVIAVFGIVLVTLSVFLQRLLVQERETRSLLNKLQAQALAESALDRAAAKLNGDRKYQGETWQPTLKNAAGTTSARVVIAVTPGSPENQFSVTVTSLFPDHPTRRAQVVSERQINLRPRD